MPRALPAQGCDGQGPEQSPMRALAPRPPGAGAGAGAALKQLWAVLIECGGFSCQQERREGTSIPVPGTCHGWSRIPGSPRPSGPVQVSQKS